MKRPLAAAMALLLTGSCTYAPRTLRTLASPEEVATLDRRAPYLKAHLKDGTVYVLSDWKVDESAGTVRGEGERQGPDRVAVETGPFTLRIDSVALFEANVVPKSESLRDITLIAGFSLAITAACLTNPKACFGSCPTFYTGTGDDEILQAEGFSTSISPALEQTDLDALYRARVAGRRFEVHMRNEAIETHVVRHAHVLAAPRPHGGRVIATGEGEMRQVFALHAPSSCVAVDGDCRPAMSVLDGRERASRTDGHDLATREDIELEFDAKPGQSLGLVVGARQTLLTTYLFYQTLAYMGRSAGAWLAELERGRPTIVDRAHAMRDLLGGIEVLVPDAHGGWITAGNVHETGPLASDVKLLPLPQGTRGNRVRLRLTRGHWRLDYVALARVGGAVDPIRLRPVEVVREGAGRIDAFTTRPLTAMPGEAHRLVYELPKEPERYELFLESRGYYLEWMREAWLADEDPLKAMQVLWNPRQALIDLAPAFKQQEDAMEDAFWKSRYVRR